MFPDSAIQAFKDYAVSQFPYEACGFIVDGNFIPCANVAENPQRDFQISEVDYVVAASQGEVQAVLHSHVPAEMDDGSIRPAYPFPSKSDQEHQPATGVPWGITIASETGCTEMLYFGDEVPIRPLVGRPFIPGVYDCFSLVRDYYRLKGIILPNPARDYMWWEQGENLYLDWWEQAGFRKISQDEVREGDGCIMTIRSKVPNHAAIYTGDEKLLQHFQDFLSHESGVHPWTSRVNFWVRHKDMEKHDD